jgi:hypothetical protein
MLLFSVREKGLPFNSEDDNGKFYANRVSFSGNYFIVDGLPRYEIHF